MDEANSTAVIVKRASQVTVVMNKEPVIMDEANRALVVIYRANRVNSGNEQGNMDNG